MTTTGKITSLTSLRAVLYEQAELLRDGKADLDRAKAIALIAKQAILSARLQVDAVRLAGNSSVLLKNFPELLPA